MSSLGASNNRYILDRKVPDNHTLKHAIYKLLRTIEDVAEKHSIGYV